MVFLAENHRCWARFCKRYGTSVLGSVLKSFLPDKKKPNFPSASNGETGLNSVCFPPLLWHYHLFDMLGGMTICIHMSWNHSGNELRPHIFQDPIYFWSDFLRVMMKSDKFWWKSVEIRYPEASDSWHHRLPQHFPFFQSAMTHKVSAQRCSRGSRTACHTSLERNITMRPLRGARSTKRSWSGAVADSWQYQRVHWVYQDLKDFYGCLWICALQIFDGFCSWWFSMIFLGWCQGQRMITGYMQDPG